MAKKTTQSRHSITLTIPIQLKELYQTVQKQRRFAPSTVITNALIAQFPEAAEIMKNSPKNGK